MAAWGTDSFANDDALDWLVAFTDAPSVEMLRDTLQGVLGDDDDLDATYCAEALAAAEIVAALSGRSSPAMPPDLQQWLGEDHGLTSGDLVRLARAAVGQVFKSSDLRELWEGSEDWPRWEKEMKDLVARLT